MTPRKKEPPLPEDVLREMRPCVPYTAPELAHRFDAGRHTIKRRLNALVEEGVINKKYHASNHVTYWRPPAD